MNLLEIDLSIYSKRSHRFCPHIFGHICLIFCNISYQIRQSLVSPWVSSFFPRDFGEAMTITLNLLEDDILKRSQCTIKFNRSRHCIFFAVFYNCNPLDCQNVIHLCKKLSMHLAFFSRVSHQQSFVNQSVQNRRQKWQGKCVCDKMSFDGHGICQANSEPSEVWQSGHQSRKIPWTQVCSLPPFNLLTFSQSARIQVSLLNSWPNNLHEAKFCQIWA